MSERLVAYAPNGPRLGVLPWPLQWSATVPHLDLGAASLTYSRKVAGGALLERGLTDGLEVALEVWNGAQWMEPRGARYIAVERDVDPSDPSDTVALACPAYGWVLSKVKHAAPSEALYSQEDGPNKGRRQFIGVTAGTVIKTLRDEYVARGGAPISLGFSTANDSNGNAWPALNAFWVSRGEALDVTLGRLVDGGSVDWWWEGRTLHMAPPAAGRERGSVVILRTGREVAESPSKETIAELISAHTLEGGEGLVVTTTEPTAPTPWGRWEGFASDDRVTISGSATARNQQVLAEAGRLRGQYTRDLTPLCPHRLGIDVWPGDWITAPTSSPGERVRVATLLWRSDSQGVTRSLTLNDSLLDRELRRARKERLGTDGGSNGAGSTVKPAPEGIDKRIPAAPTGLAVATQAYIDEQGVAQGLISGTWNPVTAVRTADGGGSVEIQGYQMAVRRNVVGAPWTVVAETDTTAAEHAPLPVGESVQVRVRARGRYSYYLGEWSSVVTLDVASDTTAPPVPSAPIVSARLGVVQVEWNGLAAGGGSGVPVDYARTEVAVGTTTTPTTVKGQILRAGGMAHINGLPYSTQHWVRLRSVDRSGNVSAWSAATAVTVTPLVDADLIGTTIEQKFSDANDAIDAITDNVIPDLANDITVADGRFTGSTSAPTLADGANKPVNALWSQYDGERLVGTWLWTGSAWVERDPQTVHIDTGTFGDLDGIRLKAHSIATNSLAVGVAGNLLVDPQFNDPDVRADRMISPLWYYAEVSGEVSLRIAARTDGQRPALRLSNGDGRAPGIPVAAGSRYVLTLDVWGECEVYLQVRYANGAVETPGGSVRTIPDGPGRRTTTVDWAIDDVTHANAAGTLPVEVTPFLRSRTIGTEQAAVSVYQVRFAPQVGSTLIEPGAVTSDKIYADQAMANTFAGVIGDFGTTRTNWLEADHIDAGSFRGYVIEGADIKSNNPGDPNNNIRLHDRTLTVNRDDGEGGQVTTTQLGGSVSDQLILRNTAGATRAMLDAATGTGSVSGEFSVGSLRHDGDLLTDLLARLPQGVLAYHKSAGDSRVAGSAEIGYVESPYIPIRTDRMYRVAITGIIAAQTAGDRARVWLKSYDAAAGTVYRQMGQMVLPTSTGDIMHVETTLRGWVDGSAVIFVTFQNATANRGVFFSGRPNYPTTFVVEDVGPADLAQVGQFNNSGTPLSGGTPTNETGAQTYTKTYDSQWTRSWRGGSTVSDFLHHGQWGGIQRYSMVGFDNAALTSDLSGATIVKAEVLLDNQHWYYNAGGTLRVGSATNTTAPSSPVTSGTVATTAQGYGQQIWAAVGGFTTASRAITLGVGAGSSLENYGKQSNSGVKLRLTFRK